MRRFRNPRYAPEGLERKLNPSGFGIPVTAEVAPATPSPAPAEPAEVGMGARAARSSFATYDPPPTVPKDPAPSTGEPPWDKPPVPPDPDTCCVG